MMNLNDERLFSLNSQVILVQMESNKCSDFLSISKVISLFGLSVTEFSGRTRGMELSFASAKG